MIGSAIDSECTTDRAGVGASDAPLTGPNRVTRHAPLWPPLKIVNMRTWKRGTGCGSSSLVIPRCAIAHRGMTEGL